MMIIRRISVICAKTAGLILMIFCVRLCCFWKMKISPTQLRRQYRYIFVDEYQDSNIVQNALLKILAREGVLLTAIGDANQSIYGFRGSRVELFRRFQEDFAPAQDFDLAGKLPFRAKPFGCLRPGHGRGSITGQASDPGQISDPSSRHRQGRSRLCGAQIEKLIGGLDMNTSRTGRAKSGGHSHFIPA